MIFNSWTMCVFHLSTSPDYVQEQEMEIEALQAILMDDFKGLSVRFLPFHLYCCHIFNVFINFSLNSSLWCFIPEIDPSESGLNTSNRCFQITLSPQVHILLSASISLFWVRFSKGIVIIFSHEIPGCPLILFWIDHQSDSSFLLEICFSLRNLHKNP